MTEIKTVILKNGAEEVKSLVIVAMLSLKKIFEEDPIAFYELNEMCKDRTHKLFGNTEEILSRYKLIENGEIHDSIRNIVLSAVSGGELDMTLSSPINK